ncbi:MAG: class I SAM-dependent methyltransferase [Candidatus Limnocylindria bacterium]
MVSTLAPLVSTGLRKLPFGRRITRFLLEQTWSRGNAEMLDRYLVSGFQNPRVNMQSVLVRHFLISKLFGSTHDQLAQDEVRFAVELNDMLRRRAVELGVTMGSFLDPAKQAAVQRVDQVIADRQMEFEARWSAELAALTAEPLRVLEFACGSANDYRAFVAYGLARHLDYTGVDLTSKNIENALRRFPDARFQVGDILDLPYADASFDFVIASDIFEHLAPDEMERALDEASRLARRGVALTFFNMSSAPDHLVQRRRAYHWNRLSASRVEDRLRRHFSAVTTIPVAAWLKERFDYPHSYNRHAYTIFAESSDASPGGG